MNSSAVHRDGVISGDYYYVISSYGIYRSPKTSSSYRAHYIWSDGSLNAYANDFVDDYSYGTNSPGTNYPDYTWHVRPSGEITFYNSNFDGIYDSYGSLSGNRYCS